MNIIGVDDDRPPPLTAYTTRLHRRTKNVETFILNTASMKTISYVVLLILAIAMTAVGCSSTSTRSEPTAFSTNAVLPPQGEDSEYLKVFNTVLSECGTDTHLVYLYSISNSYLGGQRIDTYVFTAGNCGAKEQLISVLYNRDTGQATIDQRTNDNPNQLLRPIPLSDWNIDYDQAVALASIAVRSTFLHDHPTASMIVGLSFRKDESFRWEVIFKSPDGTSASVFIDAQTGSVSNQ
jgi:hypothetical protein